MDVCSHGSLERTLCQMSRDGRARQAASSSMQSHSLDTGYPTSKMSASACCLVLKDLSLANRCRFQLRCVLMQPLVLKAGQAVQGSLRLTAHNQQSYDLYLDLTAPPLTPGAAPQQVRPLPGGNVVALLQCKQHACCAHVALACMPPFLPLVPQHCG